ncbi:3796_t:CDS:2, partial [Racocetra persica]
NSMSTKSVKSIFGLGIQESKQLFSPPEYIEVKASFITVKASEKKEAIMNPSQLQLLQDKFSQQFEDFYGRKDKNSIEWLEAFEQTAETNNWTKEKRITIAARYLSDLAADWYRENKAKIKQ